MRIIQLLPTISYGDAVSNETLAFHDSLIRHGYKAEIYAENIDSRLPKGLAKRLSKLKKLQSEDVIIYHLSTGTDINDMFDDFNCKILIRYHNITPPDFFKPYSTGSYALCEKGLKGMRHLAEKAQYVLADSEFNKQDLIAAGYTCPIEVMPILIPFADYQKAPSQKVINRYTDDYVNVVFTGRIAPNKKQEDIIAAFAAYQKNYNPKSRLFLVGNYTGMEKYYGQLREYTKRLMVENVFFTNHVKFDEILAYYKIADLFVCMSEHEGFCVPLVEAMVFGTPIIAYDSSAIKGTLGGAGIVMDTKKPLEVAGMMDYVMKHVDLRDELKRREQERLKDFDHDVIETQFLNTIRKI